MSDLGNIIISNNSNTTVNSSLGNVIIKKDSNKILVTEKNDVIPISGNKESLIIEQIGQVSVENKTSGQSVSSEIESVQVSDIIDSQVVESNLSGNVPSITKEYLVGLSDHGNLRGLNDDDHPQYLKKTEAEQKYQPIIFIGPNPPPNPFYGQIWIQI
jgi:hypothetical protein